MSAMTGLERLKIRDGEDFLQRYPALADVIGKHMTCLRHLEIARVGHLTWALLESLQCSLVSIALDWTGDDRELFDGADGDLSVYYHFVPAFPHVYPKLYVLQIAQDDLPLVAPCIRAFSNLKRLCVDGICSDYLGDSNESFLPAAISEHRQRNISSQLAPDGPGTWQHIEELIGCLVDLYVLGLTSQTLQIRILDDLKASNLSLLSAVLSYARPLHLMVQGTGDLLADHERSLATLLCEPWTTRLESLVVEIVLGERDRALDVASPLHALAASLSRLPMRFLRLYIKSDALNPTPRAPDAVDSWIARQKGLPEPRPPPPAPLTPAEVTLLALDVDAFVRGLADATPSLGDVCVQLVGPRDSRRRAVIATSKVYVEEHIDAD